MLLSHLLVGFDQYHTCRGCSDGYLQQHANYANEAPVRWDLKRLFVLPLLRGELGVGEGGWEGLAGSEVPEE